MIVTTCRRCGEQMMQCACTGDELASQLARELGHSQSMLAHHDEALDDLTRAQLRAETALAHADATMRRELAELQQRFAAEHRAEQERGQHRVIAYAESALRSQEREMFEVSPNGERPGWWRWRARRRYDRAMLELDRIGAITRCEVCTSTFALADLPCGIHQVGSERDLAFDFVRSRKD